MGGAPLLREMVTLDLTLENGALAAPSGPGWGLEIDLDFVERHTRAS